ncbi:hypothetical protein AB9K35_11665 [Leisingera sp. XS_AS12]|uniref:hypothetical protein n=1 Tax=Leisingera sp. XS_AS12 TaxID=3241294 RepID=UPI003516C2FC
MTVAEGKVYFGQFDRVTIGQVEFKVSSATSEGYLLSSADGKGLSQLFTYRDLTAHAASGNIRVERDHFSAKLGRLKQLNAQFDLSALSQLHRTLFGVRLAYCLSVERFYRKGKVLLTYESIGKRLSKIEARAKKEFKAFVREHNLSRKKYGGGTTETVSEVSPFSIWSWYKSYREDGLVGLVDGRWKSGCKGSRLCAETEALLQTCVLKYLHPDSPTKKSIIEDTKTRFSEENARRLKKGLHQIPVPARNTILSRINSFSPFEVALHRKGEDAARKEFFPVGTGLRLGRPLERVEMDGWTVDLMTIAKSTSMLEKLAPELVREMELDGGKKRWHLIAAICCTTKCLVGLTLSKSEGTSAALDCLHMTLVDKGRHADAVGAMSPWLTCGHLDLLVTDNGSLFKSHRFIAAAHSLGIDVMRAPAGLPQLRGTIERLFGTTSLNLVSRLSGRTFSDVVERGDYPSEARAVNTVEDFATMLVRWVVDVYHNTPHEGLQGETPLECWNRLSSIYGVRPSPDSRTRRIAFGVPLNRKVTKAGVLVLGVAYNNEVLQDYFRRNRSRELHIRWLPDEIGTIEVSLNSEWVPVKAVLPEFQGRTARDWTLCRNLIRRGDPNARELAKGIIAAAFEEIDRMNAVAGQRAGILSERWTADGVARFEQSLGIGFLAGGKQDSAKADGGYGIPVDLQEGPEDAPHDTMLKGQVPPKTPQNKWRF